MNVNRNVLKIVAGALLLVSLPASAQVLGGNLGGAANGTLDGSLGRTGMHGGVAGSAEAGIDATDAVGNVRDRAQRTSVRTRHAAGAAVGTTRSRVDSTRGTAIATAHTAHAAGVYAGQRAASSATQVGASAEQNGAAQTSVEPARGVALDGSGSAATEQRAFGRSVSAEGAADGQASADRSSLSSSANGRAGVAVKKDEPAASAE